MKADRIWLDGKFVAWNDANVHVCTHTLHYGLGVFEGIRCYRCGDGESAIFTLDAHIDRLFDSAHIAGSRHSLQQGRYSTAVCKEIVSVNGFDECYIRPLVFMGDSQLGLYVKEFKVRVAVIAWVWGAYLGEEGLENGIRRESVLVSQPSRGLVHDQGQNLRQLREFHICQERGRLPRL